MNLHKEESNQICCSVSFSSAKNKRLASEWDVLQTFSKPRMESYRCSPGNSSGLLTEREICFYKKIHPYSTADRAAFRKFYLDYLKCTTGTTFFNRSMILEAKSK